MFFLRYQKCVCYVEKRKRKQRGFVYYIFYALFRALPESESYFSHFCGSHVGNMHVDLSLLLFDQGLGEWLDWGVVEMYLKKP